MKKLLFVLMVPLVLYCTTRDHNLQQPDKNSFTYSGDSLRTLAFPIGGVGTGNITIGGRGNIFEMEIFNRPAKNKIADAFFMIWAKEKGKDAVTKIVERKLLPPYSNYGFGAEFGKIPGYSRFDEVTFKGEFPFANLFYKDRSVPVQLELEAYNPYIPLDVDNSSIPAAVLNWKIKNPTDSDVEVTLSFNMKNPIVTKNSKGIYDSEKNKNEFINENNISGIFFSSERTEKSAEDFGNIFMATTEKKVNVQTHWTNGGWWDAYHIICDDLSLDGSINDVKDPYVKKADANDNTQYASLAVHINLKAGEEKRVPFYLSWYFPNRRSIPCGDQGKTTFLFRNNYAARFTDAKEVTQYLVNSSDYLYSETKKFHDLVFNSSYPAYVKDAIMSQAASLKTNLVMQDDKGNFYGFEGLSDGSGCCPGSCTHVWNYEQTLAFLFPSLERSMREIAFLNDTKENGYQSFRTLFPPHNELWQYFPAADGQMGNIVRVYREWKFSGDMEWLKKIWPQVKLALEFAWKGVGQVPRDRAWQKDKQPIAWDANKDGVMEGVMHNTYDIEFYGPNTMTTSLYLAALKACAEMASALGENDKAKEYIGIYQSGVKYCDSKLWNGNYYFQDIKVQEGVKIPDNLKPAIALARKNCTGEKGCCGKDIKKESALQNNDIQPKYQYGQGCLSDQLLGQFLAYVSGLGYILDKNHVNRAMKSVFENNFRTSFADFNNVQRVYALNDEPGLVLCSWPLGKRPALPFVYCDEVWTGIEYQVAASLIYSGLVKEGLELVRAVRSRYAGFNRNPWDEVECGHHYARAMASWAVMLALSGYQYDGVSHTLCFSPKINQENFSSFWSCGTAWGRVALKSNKFSLSVEYGTLTLSELGIGSEFRFSDVTSLDINGKKLSCKFAPGGNYDKIRLDKIIDIIKGEVLTITFKN